MPGAQQQPSAYAQHAPLPGGIPLLPVSLFNEWECPDHRAISMKHRGKCCPTCVAYADHILLAQQDSHFQQALTRARVEQQRLYYEWFEQHREGGRRATAALAEAREENAKLQAQNRKAQ